MSIADGGFRPHMTNEWLDLVDDPAYPRTSLHGGYVLRTGRNGGYQAINLAAHLTGPGGRILLGDVEGLLEQRGGHSRTPSGAEENGETQSAEAKPQPAVDRRRCSSWIPRQHDLPWNSCPTFSRW